jgi:acyl carrier protein
MNIREIILTQLAAIVREQTPIPFPDDVSDDTLLADFWLDSVAFVTLLVRIEEKVGFVPTVILEGVSNPETIGDFVALYEEAAREMAK